MPTAPAATILHVDDDSSNRESLLWVLEGEGYRVWQAPTGAEALRQARQGPDLVLLDVRLPDLDGFEVCRTLKADPATADIPVLHLSAHHVTSAERARGLEG